jgi:glycosyltransferase involved in cell wall biosynthesis
MRSTERILFAGHEIGGQMQLFAETMRAKGVQAEAAAFNADFRKFSNDFTIPKQKIPLKRAAFFLKAIQRYDVFHFFWGVSLLDFWMFSGLDLPLLRSLKKKVIVHFRGTDIVNIHYYSYLMANARGESMVMPARSRPDQLVKLERWKKYAHRILVSTPDLQEIVPEGMLIPQAVNISALPLRISTPSEIFRIVHAPTRRNTKGTEYIIQAVNNLKAQGLLVELDLVENQLPAEVLNHFAQCDAGIDQVLHGWYGKVSVELMAMGKPVICFIDDRFKSLLPDLPVISASPATLEEKIRMLMINKEINRQSAAKYRTFVERHHNVDSVTDQLLALYSNIKT